MPSDSLIEVNLQELEGVYFIVGHESGIAYSHQCGGLACIQNSFQGFLVPCSQSIAINNHLYSHFYAGPKYKGHCYDGLDAEDAALIDRLLASVGFGTLSVDRSVLDKSIEAWVYLKVDPGIPCFPYCYNSKPTSSVVMIWENSD